MSDSEWSAYGGDLGSKSEGGELSEWKRERLKDITQSPVDDRWYIRYYFSASRRATMKTCRAAGSFVTKDQARAYWARLEPELQRPPLNQGGGSRSRSPSPTGSIRSGLPPRLHGAFPFFSKSHGAFDLVAKVVATHTRTFDWCLSTPLLRSGFFFVATAFSVR